jgi:hypothetical protein
MTTMVRGKALTARANYQVLKFPPPKEKTENELFLRTFPEKGTTR